jgi:hypothetical protein
VTHAVFANTLLILSVDLLWSRLYGPAVLMIDLALDVKDGYLPGSTESSKRCVVQA